MCQLFLLHFTLSVFFFIPLMKAGWLAIFFGFNLKLNQAIFSTHDLVEKTLLEIWLINFKQRVMKYVTLCLHHCKENVPNKREVGREQDYMKHQEQILIPSKLSIWPDQARHMEDYLHPWITVSDDRFNLANFFYTLLFSTFVYPIPYISLPSIGRKWKSLEYTMIEVCGIDFIYMLYFKEPVINFGRVCKDDFLALLVSIFYVLYSYAYFFQKKPNMDFSDFGIWSHI